MRIAAVEVVAARVSPPPDQAALRALRGEWVVVLVHGTDGITGYGEATHSGDDAAAAALIRTRLGPSLAGQAVALAGGAPTPAELAHRWFHLAGADRVAATAVSAVEQALWDLAARAAGAPLYHALGGRRTGGAPAAVPLYATLNRGSFDRSPAGFAAAARQAVGDGFRAVKCAPFDGVVHGGAQQAAERRRAIEAGLERVSTVRATIGDGVDLMLDCHARFVEEEAIQLARRLEPFRLRWLEEPVPFQPDPSSLARIRAAAPMPIAAGELMFGTEQFRPLLEARAVDVLMPDVKHCGGVAELARIARLAGEHGVAVAPHNPSGPISTLASAHLCAALPNAPLLEYAWGEVRWRAALLDPPERVEQGALPLGEGAGLGAALDDATLAAHRHAL